MQYSFTLFCTKTTRPERAAPPRLSLTFVSANSIALPPLVCDLKTGRCVTGIARFPLSVDVITITSGAMFVPYWILRCCFLINRSVYNVEQRLTGKGAYCPCHGLLS